MLQFDYAPTRFHVHAAPAVRKKILLLNGHPDPGRQRYCSALCDAYEEGAQDVGWEIKRFNVGTRQGSTEDTPADCVTLGKFVSEWANQLIVVFPLWLNKPPQGLCNLFQQMISQWELVSRSPFRHRPLHMVITMDMPAFAYRALLRCRETSEQLRRKVGLAGLVADDLTFIGSIGTASDEWRQDWLQSMREFGKKGM